MKTMSDLAKVVVFREGKKRSISIAQVKEVLAILSDLLIEDYTVVNRLLLVNGAKRAKKKSRDI